MIRSLPLFFLLLISAFVGSACGNAGSSGAAVEQAQPAATVLIEQEPTAIEQPPTISPATPVPTSIPVILSATPLPPTPEITLQSSVPSCGQVLPILAHYDGPLVESLEPDPQALADLMELVPPNVLPAVEYLLDHPDSVGLAAYRLGEEEQGAYLNEEVPMPLASVVKVIHLIAYAEAAADGTIEPTTTVWLNDLEAFYLPNIDLGAHERALSDLLESGRLFGEPPAMLLDVVPSMMINQSSNAATDYLHLLLGPQKIEETAVSLGLQSQTAPCPFLGQFLIMANHAMAYDNSYQAWESYSADPVLYGRDVMMLTEAFSSDEQFRQTAIEWRERTRQPDGQAQRLFSNDFNAHGSAKDYAGLMARISLNGLSGPESSFTVRRILEWPMLFPENQAVFTNLGYKNGSLPGILTTVYYAYTQSGGNPVVVALFYRNLERGTYRQWRDSFVHDEFARWLLAEPQAIPALAAVLGSN